MTYRAGNLRYSSCARISRSASASTNAAFIKASGENPAQTTAGSDNRASTYRRIRLNRFGELVAKNAQASTPLTSSRESTISTCPVSAQRHLGGSNLHGQANDIVTGTRANLSGRGASA